MAQSAREMPFRDVAHATMQREYIRSRESVGWTLFGTEVPYGNGYGFADVVLHREARTPEEHSWIVAELKPTLQDLGEAVRQVRKAEQLFFRSHPELGAMSERGSQSFPLVVMATDENALRCADFSRLLAGIRLELFHPDRAEERRIRNRIEIHLAVLAASRGPALPTGAGGAAECCSGWPVLR